MTNSTLKDKLGVCQWFHFQDYFAVEDVINLARELNLHHLRTGISWADYHRPRGRQWYDFQMEALQEFEVLVSVWHTPPSISENGACSGPPTRLNDYADFIGEVIHNYGYAVAGLELWNEPNNRYKWDFIESDMKWKKFGAMIREAAKVARGRGVTTVLGGMIPVDPEWLKLLEDYGALENIDVIAIHGFPGMWWEEFPNWDWFRDWHGWEEKISKLSAVSNLPVWITETGFATVDLSTKSPCYHQAQVARLEEAVRAPSKRVYWYSMKDLDPSRAAIEGFHVDENEYHLGLVTFDGEKKAAFFRMKELLQS